MLAKCEISNIELLLLVVISVDEELVWEFVVGTGIAEDLSLVKYSVYISAQIDGLLDESENISAVALYLLLPGIISARSISSPVKISSML